MNRQNFGRKSGVIVDICPRDGIWMDLGELDRILQWIQAGGETRAVERAKREAREKQRSKSLKWPGDPVEKAGDSLFSADRSDSPDFIGGLIRFFSE